MRLNVKLTKQDSVLLAGTAVALSIIGTSGFLIQDSVAVIGVLIAGVVAVSFLILETYRRQQLAVGEQYENLYLQLEAISGLYHLLQPVAPLPASRGWAASPDFLRLVAQTIFGTKPKLVLEASSGLSTVIVAYCLRRLGQGRVISLEHSREHANATQELLLMHGLGDIARVVYAPLERVTVSGEDWLWYDTKTVGLHGEIDCLIVDGPPQATQRFARYPAVPILYGRMSSAATVIVDDGARSSEEEIVRRWSSEFPDLESSFLALEKGAYVLHRRAVSGSDSRSGQLLTR